MAQCSQCGKDVIRHEECDGSGDYVFGRETCGTCRGTGRVCEKNAQHDWRNGRRLSPEELEKESDCFIATAALGTPSHAHLTHLRKFRDEHLAHSDWGRSFVAWYYRNGPGLASRIRGRRGRRAFVRLLVVRPAVLLTGGYRRKE